MPSNLAAALVYIINALSSLYILVFVLRIIFPWFRVDFHNPIAQGVLKISSPLVIPVRRVIPPFGRLDTATLVVAFVLQCLAIVLMQFVYGRMAPLISILYAAAVKLAVLAIMLFWVAILIRVVLSWIGPTTHNPIVALVETLTAPIVRPFQRLIPPIGGFDFSTIFALIALYALSIAVGGLQAYGP